MEKRIYFITKFYLVSIVIIFLLSALLTACRLEGDIEALRKKTVENTDPSLPEPGSSIPAPGTPVINASDSMLTVSWQAVEGATDYEVWAGIVNDPNKATKRGDNVSGLSAVITGLTNGITYYVWVKAKNNVCTSGFSPVASGTPFILITAPQTPSAPTINIGNGQITIIWAAVAGAAQYEVFYGTVENPPSTPVQTINAPVTSTIITGLVNGTYYYIWLKAKNNVGTSGFSPVTSGVPIGNMGTVTLVSGNSQLTLNWSAVTGAEQYEVYYNTSNSIPTTPVQTVSTTTTTISGLTNGTTYYVWVKPKNTNGTGNINTAVSGKPLGTPGVPTVSPAYKKLLVTWTAVPGANEYEVYYGTGTPTTLATTTSGTTATITGLTNGITYYVCLRAKNVNGISDYGPNASNSPSVTPGLYRGNEKIGNQNLSEALSYISSNAVSGDEFYFVLGANESASPINLNYSGKTVGITLLGYDGERTITLASNGSMFTIPTGNVGVTLTLDENISLVGRSTNTASLVSLDSGNLVINAGAKISGNNADFGGGIRVYSGGTVTMNSGTISGNTASSGGGGIVVFTGGTLTINGGIINGNEHQGGYGGGGIFVFGGTLTMYDGIISGNTAARFGGGVYVYSNGSFTMYGGTISGNTAGQSGGGVEVGDIFFKKLPNGSGQNSGIIYGSDETGVDASGRPLKNTAENGYGHAVYYSLLSRGRNTTAGQTDHIDTTTGRGLSTDGNPPYEQ